MMNNVAAFWLANLVCDAIGQLSLKAASRAAGTDEGSSHWKKLAQSPWLWIGLAAFALEYIFWLSFLALVPLGMGLFVGSANVVCVMIGGRLLFDEKLTPMRLAAMGIIVAGIAMVGWGTL